MLSGSERVLECEVRATVRRLLRRAHRTLGDHPTFLPLIVRVTPLGPSRTITDRTDLVIEGFPRSANTFVTFAFRSVQEPGVVVASHVHVPAQVKAAVRRGVPTLVLVREPEATVASTVIAAPHVRVRGALLDYVHHHRELMPHRAGFVVADFDEVVTDLGPVIERVNQRFDTRFRPFLPTPEAVAAVLADIDAHHVAVHGGAEHSAPRPSAAHAPEAARVRRELLAGPHDRLLIEARALHRALTLGDA